MTNARDLKRCTTCGTVHPRDMDHFPQHDPDRLGECADCGIRRGKAQACKECGRVKGWDRFWRQKRYTTGRDTVCSDCRNERRGYLKHEPVITVDVPIKPNGLYRMYWEWDESA